MEGSIFLRHMWVPATAVTAHVNVQPLQWNIGNVHRYTESLFKPNIIALPKAFKNAPTISIPNDKEKNVDMSVEYMPIIKNEIVQIMLNNVGCR